LCSAASFDITVNMVVPTSGSFDMAVFLHKFSHSDGRVLTLIN
jgi:hypothetical protein